MQRGGGHENSTTDTGREGERDGGGGLRRTSKPKKIGVRKEEEDEDEGDELPLHFEEEETRTDSVFKDLRRDDVSSKSGNNYCKKLASYLK